MHPRTAPQISWLLPQEILERIIDFVATHSPYPSVALQNCALTAQAWRIRSQYHQHRTKCILRANNGRSLIDRYTGTLIAGYVRTLILEGRFDGDMFYEMRWKPFQDIFPCIQHLCLKDIFHNAPLAFPSSKPQHPALTSLSLWWVTFPSCESFLLLLSTLPNLSSLKLGRVQWQCVNHREDLLGECRNHLRLKKLEIESSEGLDELACVEKHLDTSYLEVARLFWIGSHKQPQTLTKQRVHDLVDEAGKSIRDITILVKADPFSRELSRYYSITKDLTKRPNLASDPGYIKLTQNIKLQYLTMGVLDLTQEPYRKMDYNWLLDTLSDLTPTEFREFHILVQIEDISRFKDLPWSHIDNLLTKGGFVNFEGLTISLADRTWLPWDDMEEPENIKVEDILLAVQHLLPKLVAKNAIQVTSASHCDRMR